MPSTQTDPSGWVLLKLDADSSKTFRMSVCARCGDAVTAQGIALEARESQVC